MCATMSDTDGQCPLMLSLMHIPAEQALSRNPIIDRGRADFCFQTESCEGCMKNVARETRFPSGRVLESRGGRPKLEAPDTAG